MYQDQSAAPASSGSNPMAITSLVASLVGWVLGGLGSCAGWLVPFGLICTGAIFLIGCVVGVITGVMARSQIKASGGMQGGQGMATAGLILGAIGLGIMVLLLCLGLVALVALALMGPAIGNVFSGIMVEI